MSGKYKLRLQKGNTEIVEFLAGELDYKVDRIQPYHLRLTHPVTGKKLDYFPQTGKATWVSSNKFFSIEDIEQWIYKNFK
jgi:hypothetical protein